MRVLLLDDADLEMNVRRAGGRRWMDANLQYLIDVWL